MPHKVEEPMILRVHPSCSSAPTATPLSILDCITGNIPTFGVHKLYPAATPDPFASDDLLQLSLSHILSAYPHYAGQLRPPNVVDVGEPYQRRCGRGWIEYGRKVDPGVELTLTSSSRALSEFLPTAEELADGVADVVEDNDGLCPNSASFAGLHPDWKDGIGLGIRITRFSCGGTSIGARVAHSLADMTSLNRFLSDWADVHRQLFLGARLSDILLPLRPCTASLVDSRALGDLNAGEPNPALGEAYSKLPQTAFDTWAPHVGGIPGAQRLPPADVAPVDTALGRPRGRALPWSTWDWAAPVSVKTIFLSAADLRRLHRNATAEGTQVSVHDALSAHIWRLSQRARLGETDPSTVVSLHFVVDIRGRVQPPLPPTTGGCPALFLSATLPLPDLAGPSGLAAAARAIRASITTGASPTSIGVILAHHNSQLDLMRLQVFFAGSEHQTTSSWVRAGAYDADFGSGRPVLAEGDAMPVDNVALFEEEPAKEGEEGTKWHERGVRVRLCLKEDVMARVLADPELRG